MLTDQNNFLATAQLELEQIAHQLLAYATTKKTDGVSIFIDAHIAEAAVIQARMGKLENRLHHREKSISITLYRDQHKGTVHLSNSDPIALITALDRAMIIAQQTEVDSAHGLPDVKYLVKDFPDLELDHPEFYAQHAIENIIEQAIADETAGRLSDSRITQSEGFSWEYSRALSLYASTDGLYALLPKTYYAKSAALIAENNKNNSKEMSCGYYGVTARDYHDLPSGEIVARTAAQRALEQLNAQKIKTCRVPVVFEAEVARSLFSHLVKALSGYAIYQEASFLLNQIDQPILPDFIDLFEDPYLKKGLASQAFDQEGVKTTPKNIIDAGYLKTYLLDSYTARKLKCHPTGHAGGVHNLIIKNKKNNNINLTELLKTMDRGVLINNLIGPGVNVVTGDYSRGAAGFWVENGVIQYPIAEITVSNNLTEMYKHILAISNDINPYHAIQTGSVLIEAMTISGN